MAIINLPLSIKQQYCTNCNSNCEGCWVYRKYVRIYNEVKKELIKKGFDVKKIDSYINIRSID